MLAAKLFGKDSIQLVECEIPQIEDGELLIKVSAAAICGSDLRMIKNGYPGVDETHPLTLGHEISGIIVKTGTGVKNYREGMRVIIAPNFGCGNCRWCSKGDYHLCSTYCAFGINVDGGFAEYIRIPRKAVEQENIICIDEQISDEEAAIFEPAACVLNGQEQVEIHSEDTVLIIGAGPIGVLHALLAKAQGAGKVLISDLSENRLKRSAEVAPFIIPIGTEKVKETVQRETGGAGVDVCITACAVKTVQEQAFELMNTKGRILFFGGLPQGRDLIQVHSNLLHYKELKVCGSTRCNVKQCRKIEELVSAGKLDLKGLISKTFPIPQFHEALEYAQSAAGLKTVITFEKKEII